MSAVVAIKNLWLIQIVVGFVSIIKWKKNISRDKGKLRKFTDRNLSKQEL